MPMPRPSPTGCAWPFPSIPAPPRSRRTQRVRANPEVLSWFTGPGGEDHSFNLLADLARIVCPTLVMGGEDDPMTPIECQADIAAALPAQLVRFEGFSACGHLGADPQFYWGLTNRATLLDVGTRKVSPGRPPQAP